MDNIDQFLDVDFPNCPEYVFGDLGCQALDKTFATFADTSVPAVPESQWPELAETLEEQDNGLDSLVTRIYNQGNEGSCVANACSQALEIVQALQLGKQNVVHLAAISLYQRIGRSPSSGAMISDGLSEMKSRGILPLDNNENRARFGEAVMNNTGFYSPYPRGWEATARKFRALEYFILRGVDELMSSLFANAPVVVGRAGHSICYCRPIYRNGRLVVKYANSWGNWGDEGFGYDSLSYIRSSASWAFGIRTAVVPSS